MTIRADLPWFETWELRGATAVTAGAGLAALLGAISPALALGAVAAIILVRLVAWRPVIGGCALAIASPLVGGLGRATLLPFLRPSEAVTLLAVAETLLALLSSRQRRPIVDLDVLVCATLLGSILVPWAYLLLVHPVGAGADTWQHVLSPFQSAVLYLVIARGLPDRRDLLTVLRVSLVVLLIVAAVGFAQLAGVPMVRAFLSDHYQHSTAAQICQQGVCRPSSFLEHWSAFGAYSLLNFVLALCLHTFGVQGISNRLVVMAMAVNAAAVVASQTQAALIGLLLCSVIILILIRSRRAGKALTAVGVGLVIVLDLFYPQIEARYHQQVGTSPSIVPQSLQTRQRYWKMYFFPAIEHHALVGTGTVIPPEIPPQLERYVDNDYLRLGFRGGIAGLVVHGVLVVEAAGADVAQRKGIRAVVGTVPELPRDEWTLASRESTVDEGLVICPCG